MSAAVECLWKVKTVTHVLKTARVKVYIMMLCVISSYTHELPQIKRSFIREG